MIFSSAHLSSCRQRHRLWLAASLLCLTSARAEVARLGNWALNADLTVSAFHDTNPNVEEDGSSTFGFTADPVLRIQRFGSATRAEGVFHFTPTIFTSDEVDNQTDASADFIFARPYTDDQLARTEARVTARRATFASSSVGQRLTANSLAGSFNQRLSRTEKFGANVGASVRAVSYTEGGFRDTREGTVSLAARYEPTALSEFTAGLNQSWATSISDDPNSEDRRLVETDFIFGANGKLTARLQSDLYVGLGFARYRGGFSGNQTLPVAGGGVQWTATAKTTLRAELDAGADFSPDGSAQRDLRLRVDATTRLYDSWLVSAGPSWRRSRIEETNDTRQDTQIGLHARVSYAPSERFNVSWSLEAYQQTSNRSRHEYDRTLNTVSSSYRF